MFRTLLFALAIFAFAGLALAVPTSGPAAVSAKDRRAYLKAHNTARAAAGVRALKWNQTLADAAAGWAGACVFDHSGGALGPYGENLAAGTNETPAQAVGSWTSEKGSYDASSPQPSHYTQVVWKATTQLGCAWVDCAPGTIFPAKYGSTPFHVCEYYPQGNVIGYFGDNVL